MIEYIVKVYDNGSKCWFLDDKLHREDGPAVEWADGDKHWYLNNKLHREDGPAVECANGDKCWFLYDKLHREEGPALECASYKQWYLNGTKYTKQEFNEKMNPSAKELPVSEISKLLGYEVKVVK